MRQPDWHPADIIAALRKQGALLSAVSCNSGLASSTLPKRYSNCQSLEPLSLISR
ncbi:helix-turn-helix domain-containing protein [Erwinia sp. OPT-41]|uniref:Helix-turn-helix domain-containing protein n=1 Tax=Erwinia plantamica TaxID=3237104 RepID=A0ABW7CGJ9_9GAMM|nr:helix-turn-helix domain-containing protein [Erwinia sp. PsM31]MDN4629207.1 helix-turn-helix domain-containing protein [Erwinia sp. PsM31]